MNRKQYEFYHEKKTHTASDFPYNTYLCTIPLDFLTVPVHWHREAELIVIKKGEGLVHVDLQPYDVFAGDIVFVLPGQLHAIDQKGDRAMEYENIIFKPELLKSGGPDLCESRFLDPLFSGSLSIPPYLGRSAAGYAEVSDCIRQIDALCSEPSHGYQLAVKGLLFQLLYHLIRNYPKETHDGRRSKELANVKRVLTFIHEHYARPITIEEIAAECHYSKSHFMKFYKDAMGMGFIQYLNDYRLSLASQLLLTSTDDILEIAQKTGFENLSYFNRLFKRKFHMTPGQFRKSTSN